MQTGQNTVKMTNDNQLVVRNETRTIILQILGSIPKGKVATYGQVAKLAGVPRHARYVGTILRNLPHGSSIPWHRVLNGKGESSFPEGSERWLLQRQKLEQEGITIIGNKIQLKCYLWQP